MPWGLLLDMIEVMIAHLVVAIIDGVWWGKNARWQLPARAWHFILKSIRAQAARELADEVISWRRIACTHQRAYLHSNGLSTRFRETALIFPTTQLSKRTSEPFLPTGKVSPTPSPSFFGLQVPVRY